jgi:predicted dinucleotide-binding enzyme
MRIGIIGSGELGSTLAHLWTKAGHEIAISNSRGPDSLKELVESIGSLARAMTVEDAARFGEVVLLAVPFQDQDALPPDTAVAGKVVIDAMNAVTETGESMDLGGKTSSEVTAERLPDARVVKAFNAMSAESLAKEPRRSVPKEQRFVLFLAGDDGRAKSRVSRLIEEIGFTPIDTGSLSYGGRLLQPGSKLIEQPVMPAEARRLLSIAG